MIFSLQLSLRRTTRLRSKYLSQVILLKISKLLKLVNIHIIMRSSLSRSLQLLVMDPFCSEALSNHLILANIFRFLDFKSLKSVRLVSQIWGVEALKRFSDFDVVINLYPPFKDTTASTLSSFLKRDQLRPCLNLTFQTPGWAYNSDFDNPHPDHPNDPGPDAWQRHVDSSHRPRDYRTTDPNAINILQGMGSWVTELRLELTLMDERDAQLVVNILATMPNLAKLCIDILDIREEGLLGFPSAYALNGRCFLPPSLIVLGLKVHQGAYIWRGHGVTLNGVIHFITAISSSNIKFLDLGGRELRYASLQDTIVVGMWREAISHILTRDPKAFSRLIGFKEEWRKDEEDLWMSKPLHDFYHSFPRSLSHLYFDFVYDVNVKRQEWVIQMDKLRQIIHRHALTLQTLNLAIQFVPIKVYDQLSDIVPVQKDVKMMPNLPILTSLSLNPLVKDVVHHDALDRLDVLNLSQLFLRGPQTLKRVLPSLTTLSIIFESFVVPEERVSATWERIFPVDLMRDGFEFHQIKHLNVEIFVEEDENGNCNSPSSPHLSRLLCIFPSLETLRHLRKRRSFNNGIDDKLWCVCKHVRHSSSKKKNGDSQITSPAWTTFTKTWNGWPDFRGEEELLTSYPRMRLRHLLRSQESDPWFRC